MVWIEGFSVLKIHELSMKIAFDVRGNEEILSQKWVEVSSALFMQMSYETMNAIQGQVQTDLCCECISRWKKRR